MIQPIIPNNEKQRLDALRNYDILDTLPEKEFDDITLLASQMKIDNGSNLDMALTRYLSLKN
jgi:hypothetical protein